MAIVNHLDLFSGIGGFSLAAQLVGGIETTQFVEINPYCQKVLCKNFPNILIHDDIKTYHPRPGQFDLVTGGSPCQDLSVAGKQQGINGSRSSLWFEQLRVFKESQATFLIWENVTGAFRNGFDAVLRSLSERGYMCEWQTISAGGVGAPHQRDRIWLIAYPTSLFRDAPPWSDQIGLQVENAAYPDYSRSPQSSASQQERARTKLEVRDTYWSSVEPPVCGVAHGLPNRLDRLTALGNSLVPQCAAIALQRVLFLSQYQ